MIRRIPIPKLPGIRSQVVVEPAVGPYMDEEEDLRLYADEDAERVQDTTEEIIEPGQLATDAHTDATRKIIDSAGRLYLENPMEAGLYAMYESVEEYNQRRSLPVPVRAVPDGSAVHIDYRTLTAIP